MLSDIVERNDGGMIVRDGEIERITESVDGREPFAHAPTKKRSVVYDDNDSPFHSSSCSWWIPNCEEGARSTPKMERLVSETKRAPRSGPNQASPRTRGMSSSDEEDERLADDGPLDASDKRVRWLAEKVSAGLGCDVDLFASCVANDDETRDRVEAFLRGALLRPRLSRRIPPQRHPRRARVGSIHGSRGLLTSFPPTPQRIGTSESEALLVYVEPNARGDAPAGTRSTPFEQSSSGNENAEATVDAPEDGGGEPEQNGERATEAVDASSRAPDDPRDDVAAFAEGDGPEPSPGDQ